MTGILLVNLGTPKSPSASDVAVYLREFLMDPYVIDIPFLVRWPLVNLIIAPFRSSKSAEAYEKVFTERGSPLMYHTMDLAKALARIMPQTPVAGAMRYGQPSLHNGLAELKDRGVKKVLLVALYPQYAESTSRSTFEAASKAAESLEIKLAEFPAFYSNPLYLDATAAVIKQNLNPSEYLLFSFHGLPERHVQKTDPSGQHCLKLSDCCDKIGPNNQRCYRAHCFSTARDLAQRLNLTDYKVSFQSRLGRNEWIKPYTELVYKELAESGVKRLAVACPSFVADCLETLEEVQIRGQESFKEYGGESLKLIPCLNSNPVWSEALAKMLQPALAKLT